MLPFVLIVWLIQLVHGVFLGWRFGEAGHKAKLWQFLVAGPLVFLASWPFFTWLAFFAAWSRLGHDDAQWIQGHVYDIGGIFSAIFAMLVIGRMMLVRVTPRFATVQIACSLLLIASMGAMEGHRRWQHIDGWFPKGAALNYLQTGPHVDYVAEDLVPIKTSQNNHYYRIVKHGEPRGEVWADRIYRIGWRANGNVWSNAADELAELRHSSTRSYYRDPHNMEKALRQFIGRHQGTPEVDEANVWLAKVKSKTTVIDRVETLGGMSFAKRIALPLKRQFQYGDRDALTDAERTVAIVYSFHHELDRAGLGRVYGTWLTEYREEVVEALNVINAFEAADWLGRANHRIRPLLVESGKQIEPTKRDELYAILREGDLPEHEVHMIEIMRRLVIFCDDQKMTRKETK